MHPWHWSPISFYRVKPEPPIAVTILPIVSDGGTASGSTGGVSKGAPGDLPGADSKTIAAAQPVAIAQAVSESLRLPSPVEVTAKSSETNVALAASGTLVDTASTTGVSGAAGNGGNAFGPAGMGSGFGNGQDSSPSAAPAHSSALPRNAHSRHTRTALGVKDKKAEYCCAC